MITAAQFRYYTYQEVVDTMAQIKRDAFEMIPFSRRHTAQFCGFQFDCYGVQLGHLKYSGCDFKVPFRQQITRDAHRAVNEHFFEHPDHEIHIYADFDFTAPIE